MVGKRYHQGEVTNHSSTSLLTSGTVTIQEKTSVYHLSRMRYVVFRLAGYMSSVLMVATKMTWTFSWSCDLYRSFTFRGMCLINKYVITKMLTLLSISCFFGSFIVKHIQITHSGSMFSIHKHNCYGSKRVLCRKWSRAFVNLALCSTYIEIVVHCQS